MISRSDTLVQILRASSHRSSSSSSAPSLYFALSSYHQRGTRDPRMIYRRCDTTSLTTVHLSHIAAAFRRQCEVGPLDRRDARLESLGQNEWSALSIRKLGRVTACRPTRTRGPGCITKYTRKLPGPHRLRRVTDNNSKQSSGVATLGKFYSEPSQPSKPWDPGWTSIPTIWSPLNVGVASTVQFLTSSSYTAWRVSVIGYPLRVVALFYVLYSSVKHFAGILPCPSNCYPRIITVVLLTYYRPLHMLL